MNPHKTLDKIRAGSKNIRFVDMVRLAQAFGFRLARVSGSHHILVRPGIPEMPEFAKCPWTGQTLPSSPQFIKLIESHGLTLSDR